MKEVKFHRNSQKRFYGDDKIYFITTATQKRFSFFKEKIFCELFIENLRLCKRLKTFKLYAFTIIPDHVHLQLKPDGKFNISEVIQSIKKTSSLKINQIINMHFEGENIYSRLQNNKFINQLNQKFIEKYGRSQFEIPNFKWQKSFHDHVIRGKKDFIRHINYIHNNCLKHGIHNDPETYPWSSLNPEYEDMIEPWWE